MLHSGHATALLTLGLPCLAASTLSDNANLLSLDDTERGALLPLAELKLGELIMHGIRRDFDYLDDAPTLEYLNNLGNDLLAARPEARGEAV